MNKSRKLNILHLTTHLNVGGISSYIGILAGALSKKGHHNAVVSSGGNAVPLLTRCQASCYCMNIRTKSVLHPKLFWNLPELVCLIRDEKIDLIHAHTRVAQMLSFLASRLTGVPYMSTAHGFYSPRLGRKLFSLWGERVVAVSELVAQELRIRHGVKAEKISTIHNALDFDSFRSRLSRQNRFKMRTQYGIPEKAVVIGCVSRLVKDKGHSYLAEAVEIVKKSVPDAFLLLVGEGRERKALERQMADLLPGSSKLIPGVLDATTVLCMMDVFVHPATHREGFGLSIAEAMAAEIPVIATDIPAINTLLADGENALIAAPKDAAALAQAIVSVIQNPSLGARLKKKARQTVEEICDPGRMAEKMEELYIEVLDRCKKKKS